MMVFRNTPKHPTPLHTTAAQTQRGPSPPYHYHLHAHSTTTPQLTSPHLTPSSPPPLKKQRPRWHRREERREGPLALFFFLFFLLLLFPAGGHAAEEGSGRSGGGGGGGGGGEAALQGDDALVQTRDLRVAAGEGGGETGVFPAEVGGFVRGGGQWEGRFGVVLWGGVVS